MAVDRSIGDFRFFGDGIDAHRHDAMRQKKVLRSLKNATSPLRILGPSSGFDLIFFHRSPIYFNSRIALLEYYTDLCNNAM